MLYDTHAHLTDQLYEQKNINIDEIITNFSDNNIQYVNNVCVQESDLDNLLKISNKYENIFFSLGIHPLCINKDSSEAFIENIKNYVNNKQFVAIGECGIDMHHCKDNDLISLQVKIFKKQIELSNQLNLPLIIHCRDAFDLLIKILSEYPVRSNFGVIHCFNGSLDDAKWLINKGFYISFSAQITYPNLKTLKDVAANLDINKILIETDSPYLSPINLKGKLNNPVNVVEVAKEISNLKQLPLETVICSTTENAKKLFNVK